MYMLLLLRCATKICNPDVTMPAVIFWWGKDTVASYNQVGMAP